MLINFFDVDGSLFSGEMCAHPAVSVLLRVVVGVVRVGGDSYSARGLGSVVLNRLDGVIVDKLPGLQLGANRVVDVRLLLLGEGLPKPQTLCCFPRNHRSGI